MGNILVPELKKSNILSITTEQKSYAPNSKINILISLNVNSPMTLNNIEINLYYIEGWKHSKPKESTKDHAINKKNIYTINLNLLKIYKLNSFNPGKHSFSYILSLNKISSPSFEFRGELGRIFARYIISAKIVLPNLNKNINIKNNNNNNNNIIVECENIFQVISNQKINDKEEKYTNQQQIFKWGMINRGVCQLRVYLPKINYKFNDNLPISIIIDNSISGLTVNRIKLTFKRKLTYIDENGSKFSEEKNISSETYYAKVKIGEKKMFKYHYNIRDPNSNNITIKEISEPYNDNSIDWRNFIPSTQNPLFSCDYSVKVTVYFESFVNHNCRPRIIIPIIVTHNCSNKYDFVEEENEEVKFNNINLKESYFGGFVVEDYGNEINNNKEEKKKEKNELENIVTDDGSGQLFKYYENLKKKKYEEERKKREEEIKKREEDKEMEIKLRSQFVPFNNYVNSNNNNNNFNLFIYEGNDNNIYIPPVINNDENFSIF